MGISVPTVSNLENGKNTSLETFIAVVFALGLQQELQELFSKRTVTIAELEQLYAEPKRQRASSKVVTAKPVSAGLGDTAKKKSSHPRSRLWDKTLFNSDDVGDK